MAWDKDAVSQDDRETYGMVRRGTWGLYDVKVYKNDDHTTKPRYSAYMRTALKRTATHHRVQADSIPEITKLVKAIADIG